MATSFFDTGNDPFTSINQDVSAQRTQVAQYSIMRAATFLQSNKNDEALKEFHKALAFDPQNSTAQLYVGKLNLAKGNNYEAIKAFTTLVKSQPNTVDAYINLGNAYLQDKQYAPAEKEFKAAARLDPGNPVADYTLGLLYSNTDRLIEAENQFLKVQKISPNDGNVFYALGMVYNKQGKYEEAAKNLEKSLSLKKTLPDANYELGAAYNALGRPEDAQNQLAILQSSGAPQALELQFLINKPRIAYIDQGSSKNFISSLGPRTELSVLGPVITDPLSIYTDPLSFYTAGNKELSVAIQFTNEMDIGSVMNPANWDISKGNTTEAGFYFTGQSGRDIAIPKYPAYVNYNPVTRLAMVSFIVQQNAAGDATLDPSHLVFKFSGIDAAGRPMDTSGNEIDGAASSPF
jgi:Tfp pilus assembly protein PilF